MKTNMLLVIQFVVQLGKYRKDIAVFSHMSLSHFPTAYWKSVSQSVSLADLQEDSINMFW